MPSALTHLQAAPRQPARHGSSRCQAGGRGDRHGCRFIPAPSAAAPTTQAGRGPNPSLQSPQATAHQISSMFGSCDSTSSMAPTRIVSCHCDVHPDPMRCAAVFMEMAPVMLRGRGRGWGGESSRRRPRPAGRGAAASTRRRPVRAAQAPCVQAGAQAAPGHRSHTPSVQRLAGRNKESSRIGQVNQNEVERLERGGCNGRVAALHTPQHAAGRVSTGQASMQGNCGPWACKPCTAC